MDVATSSRPAAHTLGEIFSQPQCWNDCLRQLKDSRELEEAAKLAKPGDEWVFIGCGSSYYLAMSAAATFVHLGIPARALPASEIILYSDISFPKGRTYCPVLISRSGLTSEVLQAARILEQEKNLRTIGISCTDGTPLQSIASVTLKLLAADEKSTVMTRSFTSMLLALQYLASVMSGCEKFGEHLLSLPAQVSPLMESIPNRLRDFTQPQDFADYIFLAQGPLFGIANEAMLKVTESSCSYAQVFHTLEFRHGPKAVISARTLVTFLLSENSYAEEVAVLEEMKRLGAGVLAIGNATDVRVRRSADFVIELGLQVPEYARLAAYTIWGQLYGVYNGRRKGLDPDSPKNLTRVVLLDGHH
jgi:glucosamine--fructose-6-phosphate aminotransferase (isomerizing)